MSSDPIGDMFAMLRNANAKFLERVELPSSKIKKEIVHLLKEEGYLADYKVLPDRKQGSLRIFLRYQPNRTHVLQGIKRVSRPGLRSYCGAVDLPKIRGGLGTVIVSTSKGLMTDAKARQEKLGGEILGYVW
jgi:small subunit ribosomal protein S8